MPNWIHNIVNLRGSEKTIKEVFKKHFVAGNFDYDTIIPQPKTKKECPKQYICDPVKEHIEPTKGREWFNWYSWNYDNWGVKWNACDTLIVDKNEGNFEFDSPWGSPHEVFLALSKLYPDLGIVVDVDGECDYPYCRVYSEGGYRDL